MCQSREQLIRETRVLFRELIIENKVYGRLYRHYTGDEENVNNSCNHGRIDRQPTSGCTVLHQ